MPFFLFIQRRTKNKEKKKRFLYFKKTQNLLLNLFQHLHREISLIKNNEIEEKHSIKT